MVNSRRSDPLGVPVPSLPLNAAPPAEANGNLRAVGFTLARLWEAAGMTGIFSKLEGLGAINANVRIVQGK